MFASTQSKHRSLILSPKFSTNAMRNELRTRFKNRIRENRATLLDNIRSSSKDKDLLETTLKDMLFEDIGVLNDQCDKQPQQFQQPNDVDKELEILVQIEREFVDDELRWLTEEYEKAFENCDGDYMDSFDEVVCPLCLKCPLKHSKSTINCMNCGMMISCDKNNLQLKEHISGLISTHGAACGEQPQFCLIPDSNNRHLYMICDSCSLMAIVI